MRCEEFRGAYLAGHTQPEHEAHLRACQECRSSLPRLDELLASLADTGLWEEPPSGLEERVIATIAGQTPGASGRRWNHRWLVGAAAGLAVVGTLALLTWALDPGRPDWELALAGTEESPSARATVTGWNTESGLRMELHATDLAAAPAGFYYELWLSSLDRLVSAGTFRYGEEVVLWAGITRADAPRLWVTLEPVDGEPSPSGVTVLDSG
ncbi:MAG TPA: anti-sigma factor [Acidimicrobiia bacterium]